MKYSFDPFQTASKNLADSARLSHVYGNPDDYADWNDWDREELRKPLVQSYDNEEAEKKFREIIASHAERWKKYTVEERTPSFYAHKYFSLFEDIYRLMEKYPRYERTKEYEAILGIATYYEEKDWRICGFTQLLERREQLRHFFDFLKEKKPEG